MATFPIVRTTREASVPIYSPGDTAATARGEGMQALGKEVFDLGMTDHIKQGQNQLAELYAQDQADLNELNLNLQRDTDETHYRDYFEDTWERLSQRQATNGWARERRARQLPTMRAQLEALVAGETHKRIEDKQKFVVAQAAAEAGVTGSTANLRRVLSGQVATGEISQEEMDKILYAGEQDALKARRRDTYEKMTADAANEPQAWMAANPDAKAMMSNYADAQASDYPTMRRIASAQATWKKAEQEEVSTALINDTLAHSWNTDPATFAQQLQMTPTLTEIQKNRLWNIYWGAASTRQTKGVNPFVETQDYGRLQQAIIDVERGKLTTLTQLDRDYTYEGNKVNFSINDRERIKKMIEDKNKIPSSERYSLTHPVAKGYFDALQTVYADKKGQIPDDKRADYVAKRFALEDLLNRNWGDAKAIEAEYQALVQEAKQNKVKGWLRAFLSVGSTLPGTAH
jgi:hypothetical protein